MIYERVSEKGFEIVGCGSRVMQESPLYVYPKTLSHRPLRR
jgi:hypothetical protein